MTRLFRYMVCLGLCLFVGLVTESVGQFLVAALLLALVEIGFLCLDAEINMREGMERSKLNSPNTENCAWWTNKAGTQHFYKTDEKLRRSFRVPFCWLPVSWLWRVSLWIYFW